MVKCLLNALISDWKLPFPENKFLRNFTESEKKREKKIFNCFAHWNRCAKSYKTILSNSFSINCNSPIELSIRICIHLLYIFSLIFVSFINTIVYWASLHWSNWLIDVWTQTLRCFQFVSMLHRCVSFDSLKLNTFLSFRKWKMNNS